MNEINNEEIKSILFDVSKEFILPKFKNLKSEEIQFKNKRDLVTQVDLAVEEKLNHILCSLLPNSLFVGEEKFYYTLTDDALSHFIENFRLPPRSNKSNSFQKGWRQVCAYAFPKKVLKIFSSTKKKTELEDIEDIEYLRFLELGLEVRTLRMSKMSLAVDTPGDVISVKKMISKLGMD